MRIHGTIICILVLSACGGKSPDVSKSHDADGALAAPAPSKKPEPKSPAPAPAVEPLSPDELPAIFRDTNNEDTAEYIAGSPAALPGAFDHILGTSQEGESSALLGDNAPDEPDLTQKIKSGALDAIKSYMHAMESGDAAQLQAFSTEDGYAGYERWNANRASAEGDGETDGGKTWKERGLKFFSDSEGRVRVDQWNNASVSFQLTLQGGKWKVTGINVQRDD